MSAAILLAVALKGAAVLAIAFLVLAALRDAPAALRHGVWTAAFAALLVVPVLGVYGPVWQLPLLPAETSSARVFVDVPATRLPHSGIPAPPTPPVPPQPPAVPGAPPLPGGDVILGSQSVFVVTDGRTVTVTERTMAAPPFWSRALGGSWIGWLVGAWALGAVLVLARWVGAYASAARLVARAQPVTDEGWLDAAELARRLVGVRKPVRLLVSDALTVPVAWGYRRFAVVLPAEADTWSDERREAVLLHEMAHLRRDDARTQLVAQLAVALHWPNPLAWLAYHRFLVEREHACDDAVLSGGAAASDYAGHLVEIARRAGRREGLAMSAMSPMARRSQLEGRILSILDAGRRRVAAGRGSLGTTVALGLLVAAPLAVFSPVAAEASRPASAIEVGPADDMDLDEARTMEALTESALDPSQRDEVEAAVALAVQAATDRLPEALLDTIPRAGAVLGPALDAALADVRRMRADGFGLSDDAWDEIEDGVRDAFADAHADYDEAVAEALAMERDDEDWRDDLRESLAEAAADRAEALAEAEEDRAEALAEMAEAVAGRTAGWNADASSRRINDRAARARQEAFRTAERARLRAQQEAHRSRDRALQAADRDRQHALRDAEHARQEALRDAERARRNAASVSRSSARASARASASASVQRSQSSRSGTGYAYSIDENGVTVSTATHPGVGAWMAQLDDLDRALGGIEQTAIEFAESGKAPPGVVAGLRGGLAGIDGALSGVAQTSRSWARSDAERSIAQRRLDATRARLLSARRHVEACD